ncbi:MAG: hypothetical protein OET07_17880, partial [Desulfobacteraceae bacterium]|nr:hypothetical protein [Desulfobacteraceae bacterium]
APQPADLLVSNDRLRTHYIVFSERKPWMKIPAIDVKSATPPKCFDLLLIPLVVAKFTSWQETKSF